MQIKKQYIYYGILILVVLLGIFLVKPLFAPGIPLNVDLPCHYTRIWCIQEASANVPNNWCPHQAAGMPSSQTYYPPLDFLIAMLGYIFGLEWTFKIFVTLSLFLPGIGAYWFLKKQGHETAAVIAFALLALFPGSWQAGGFEETVMVGFWHYMSTLGFLLLSLTYYIELLKTGQKRNLFWAGFFTIFVAHPFSILYAAILFITATLYYHKQALQHYKSILLFVGIAVLLNAYYWLPLFAKLSYFPDTGNVAMTWQNVKAYLIGKIPWHVWISFLIGILYFTWKRKEQNKLFFALGGVTLAYALKELWIPPFYSGDRVMVFLTLWVFVFLALFLEKVISMRIATQSKKSTSIPLWPLALILLLITGYGFYQTASGMSKNIFTSSHASFAPQLQAFDLLKSQPQGRVVMEETLYNYGNNPQSLTHTECAVSALSGKEGVNFALAYFPRKTSVIHHDNQGNFFNKPIKSYTPEEIQQRLQEFNINYVIAHTQPYADVMVNHSEGYKLIEPIALFKTNIKPSYFKTTANLTQEEYTGTYAKTQVTAQEPTLVTLKVNAYPNWKAYVDGKETEVEECDYFVCTQIPPGQHTVEFKYETIIVDYLGYFLSLLGLIGLAGIWRKSKHDPPIELDAEEKNKPAKAVRMKKERTEIGRRFLAPGIRAIPVRPEKRAKQVSSVPSWIKKEFWVVLILGAVLSFIFLHPILKNLDYLGIRDWGAMVLYPYVSKISLLVYHQIPLWNPFQCGGNLLLAHPHTPILSPFFIFTLLFNVMPGIKISFLAYYILGFIGAYYLAKHYQLEWRSALFVSVIYTFTTTLPNLITEGYAHWGAQMLIPWMILFYLKSIQNLKYTVLGAITLAWIILSGYYWGFVILFTTLSLYALFETIRNKKARYLIALALIFAIAFFLCALKIFPLVEYSAQYPKIDTEVRSAYTWKALYTALLDNHQAPYAHAGPGGEWFNFSSYLGWIPLLLALLGLFMYTRTYWPLALTGLATLWISFGDHAWVNLYALLKYIPVITTSFHSPARFHAVFFLILVLFAGFALQRFLTAQRIQIGKNEYTFTPDWTFRKNKNQYSLPEHTRTLIVLLLTLYFFAHLIQLSSPTLAVAFPAPQPPIQASPEFFQIEAPNFPNPYTGSQDLFGISSQGSGLVKKEQALPAHNQGQLILPIYDSLYGNREYIHLLAGIGTTNCYSTFHPPPNVQARFHWNGTQNPHYRGEAYLLNGKGEAKITQFSPNQFVVEGGANENDVLVLNQNYYDGWKSDQGEVANTNGLISIPVNPGNFHVEFYFEPISFTLGAILSLLTLALILLWALHYRHKLDQKVLHSRLWKKWGEYY
ncbi:MAG TPA: hypothetical protein VJG90_06395 [Candidatus Nanoarchaeia archaeon]|nr:hypothetical protein [Candidatus Nanoarchaeia archaeon]